MLRRFPVIVGPTAGGKSALAVAVAHELSRRGHPGAIVTADSMQVYRGMDIGTAKPTVEEREGIAHHLLDLVEPDASFSVDRWLSLAHACIDELRSSGAVPVVVGGTHLYVKALLDGLFDGPLPDVSLRAVLAGMGLAALREELERVDPEAAARIHPNDERRTIRALEVFRVTGVPISDHQRQWDDHGRDDALLVILRWAPEPLNQRINARVRVMVERGLVEEVHDLWAGGVLGEQAVQALGYKQLIEHFEGRASLEQAVEKIKIETRRFAKNQRTWLKRLSMTPGCLTLDPEGHPTGDLSQRVCDSVLAAEQT